ncbi:MAG: Uma2 family endonuclease [Pyrinomonadaceae bacterium]
MSTQPTSYLSPDEYLAIERESDTKSEYLDGVVYAMTGASINHIRIVTGITIELGNQLRGRKCDVLSNEMKVRLANSRQFFYPDVTVVCGEPQFHDERRDIILNPLLIVEVLSPSTESFDRGAKFQAYQRLDSLREYLLVAQDRPVIEQFVRESGERWTYQATIGAESSLMLPSIECSLNLSAVYDKVVWE